MHPHIYKLAGLVLFVALISLTYGCINDFCIAIDFLAVHTYGAAAHNPEIDSNFKMAGLILTIITVVTFPLGNWLLKKDIEVNGATDPWENYGQRRCNCGHD